MKILNLRFKNLNSLAGEWSIDFADPSFVTDGIFAITGPTGSGKTTILDALCLALYGSTPRLDKVTGGSNEIMSRGTGECSSELTFEVPGGRYRCTWSQHKAKRRATGELQNPKHELANADTGELLASSIKAVLEKVEAITGLDFKRFTRSMLLAQGAFAVFLQSSSSERAPILEQLTRTEIYSQLSIRVHERERAERAKLEQLATMVEQLSLMPEELEVETRQQLQLLETELVQLNRSLLNLQEQVAWRKRVEGLKKEIAQLELARLALKQELEAFQPIREQLRRANAAAELDGPAATLDALRRAQVETKKKIDELKAQLPREEADCKSLKERHQLAERSVEFARRACLEFEPRRRELEELDRRVEAKRSALAEQERKRQELERRGKDEQEALLSHQRQRSALEQQIHELELYLRENVADAWLVTGLSGIEVQLASYQQVDQEIEVQQKELGVLEAKVALLKRDSEKVLKQQQIAQAKVERTNQQLAEREKELQQALQGRSLTECRGELTQLRLRKERANLVASLEEHRARLHPGEECPLCGAIEHPFKSEGTPAVSQLEEQVNRLSDCVLRAEELDSQIRELIAAKSQADGAVANESEVARRHLASIEREELALKAAQGGLEKGNRQRADLERAILSSLRPLGIEQFPQSGSGELRASLVARRRSWEEKSKAKQEVESRKNTLSGELGRIEERAAGLERQKEQLVGECGQLQSELANEVRTRKERFGEMSAAEEAERLAVAQQAAERLERTELAGWTKAKEKLAEFTALLGGTQSEWEQREKEIKPDEVSFFRVLSERGFASEAEFQAARMSPEQRKELGRQDEVLVQRGVALGQQLSDQHKRLVDEQSKNLSSEPLEVLEAALSERQQLLNTKNQSKGAKEQVLKENEVKKLQAAQHQQEAERQQAECRRWAKLHELIGSSDGKKFRDFAQTVTFDRLIAHANQQLAKMSDRYELVPAATDPLELCVRDNDQGGEIRTTRNLSGGESFLVSLSLALGLSQMASGRVRVDSLFLDEGFGTLDEGALETALSTLADLRQTGKLIGLISHVPALNERISTKIEVRKIGEGRSVIRGPGCARVSPG